MSFDSGIMGRLLLVLGLGIAVVGLLMALGVRLPFGRLPGDFSGGGGNVSWAFPLGTSLLLSVVLTIVLNIVLRR
jgi:hypothetical protein